MIKQSASNTSFLDRCLATLEYGLAMRTVKIPAAGLMEFACIGVAVIYRRSKRRK
jgi:hypothetical protein